MDDFSSLLAGFQVALSWHNIGYMALGVILGIVVGVLPGLGGPNGVAILLPLTFGMDPTSAIILLSSIYWGALFGGAITSILFNIPGEAWSVATTFDGYPMAVQGRAAEALTAAFTASFIGALSGVILITFVAPLVASFALRFGPAEFFAVFLLTFCSFVGMGRDHRSKIIASLCIGFLLGMSKVAGEVLEPMLVALYSIPKVTLYPILLLAFGLGMPAKIAFGALHGFIPIALFTINAVRNVRPILVKTGRVMKFGRFEMISRIVFPAALPEIFTGLRIGFSLTMIGTVLGEMFASQRGFGYMLMNAIGLHNLDVIMAITLLLVVFAALVSSLLLMVDRRLHKRF